MAFIIPEIPIFTHEHNQENYVYEKLSKLSDEYYIFHSLNYIDDQSFHDKKIYDGEIDFLIFHPQKGILILETKAGVPFIKDGEWYYQKGIKMPHQGPFNQAKIQKYAIQNIINKRDKTKTTAHKIIYAHAVCFPSLSEGQLKNIKLPIDSPIELIIHHQDLNQLEDAINRIFSKMNQSMSLSEYEKRFILQDCLAPTYKIVGIKGFDINLKEQKYVKLLQEQSAILDFLQYQAFATIHGSAGTGKTLIALEKARQLASLEENVLFLCYNRQLKDDIEFHHQNSFIDYFTIDLWANQYRKKTSNAYEGLSEFLEACFLDESVFKYKHVIIDEGQDFGITEIENAKILENIKLNIQKTKGFFYIFYDKYQLVQGEKVPEIIETAECKMSLYKNCRNTKKIAYTSMNQIDLRPTFYVNSIEGNQTQLYQFETQTQSINKMLNLVDQYHELGYQDIVVLSLTAKDKSMLNGKYPEQSIIRREKGTFKWTTSRKFKGLEADVVILIDVLADTINRYQMLLYVASSRAKHELAIIVTASKKELKDVLQNENSKLNQSRTLEEIFNAVVK